MLKASPSERTKRRAQTSWEQCQLDLAEAQKSWKKQPDKSCLQSTQAVVNALGSVLEAEGYFQLPAYSAVEMLDYCIQVDTKLEDCRGACYVVDGSLERDMFGKVRQKGVQFNPPFAKACMEAAEEVIKQVRKYWKEYKESFIQ